MTSPEQTSVERAIRELREELQALRDDNRRLRGDLDMLRSGRLGTLGFKTAALAGANSIDTGHVVDGAITTTKIEDAAITNAKIEDATIESAKIADATITNAKIADATIASAKIASLEADKITAGTGIINNLSILATLLLGAGGKIQDADGSYWDQTGFSFESAGTEGDSILFKNGGVTVGYISQDNTFLGLGSFDGLSVGTGAVMGPTSMQVGQVSLSTIGFTHIDIDTTDGFIGINGSLGLGGASATIATGVVTYAAASFLTVDTEGAAATDNLDTISASGGATLQAGAILVLKAADSARTVSVTEAGNIKLSSAPFALDNVEDTLTLIYDGSAWLEIARSNNGA